MAHYANTCKNLIFSSPQEAPTLAVVNFYLIVYHSRILSYLQFMMAEIMSYSSSDVTLHCLTERPKTLVIVLGKSPCSVTIILYLFVFKYMR